VLEFASNIHQTYSPQDPVLTPIWEEWVSGVLEDSFVGIQDEAFIWGSKALDDSFVGIQDEAFIWGSKALDDSFVGIQDEAFMGNSDDVKLTGTSEDDVTARQLGSTGIPKNSTPLYPQGTCATLKLGQPKKGTEQFEGLLNPLYVNKVKLLHPENEYWPRYVTEYGMTTEIKLLHP